MSCAVIPECFYPGSVVAVVVVVVISESRAARRVWESVVIVVIPGVGPESCLFMGKYSNAAATQPGKRTNLIAII